MCVLLIKFALDNTLKENSWWGIWNRIWQYSYAVHHLWYANGFIVVGYCLLGVNSRRCSTQHYSHVILSAMKPQITGVLIVYWSVYSGLDQRKHQNSTSLTFERGIHWWPENLPHKGSVTQKMHLSDDVIMKVSTYILQGLCHLQQGITLDTMHLGFLNADEVRA